MAVARPVDLSTRPVETAKAWDARLATHAGDIGMWLEIAKKGAGVATLTDAEGLAAAAKACASFDTCSTTQRDSICRRVTTARTP